MGGGGGVRAKIRVRYRAIVGPQTSTQPAVKVNMFDAGHVACANT